MILLLDRLSASRAPRNRQVSHSGPMRGRPLNEFRMGAERELMKTVSCVAGGRGRARRIGPRRTVPDAQWECLKMDPARPAEAGNRRLTASKSAHVGH